MYSFCFVLDRYRGYLGAFVLGFFLYIFLVGGNLGVVWLYVFYFILWDFPGW